MYMLFLMEDELQKHGKFNGFGFSPTLEYSVANFSFPETLLNYDSLFVLSSE